MQKQDYIIAVDFDGTLYKGHQFPEIGEPRTWLIELLKQWQMLGCKLILWTCREDVDEGDIAEYSPRLYLTEAIEWCKEHGLKFDAVNQNYIETRDPSIKTSRKVFAHLYIDDRSILFDDKQEHLISTDAVFEYINTNKSVVI